METMGLDSTQSDFLDNILYELSSDEGLDTNESQLDIRGDENNEHHDNICQSEDEDEETEENDEERSVDEDEDDVCEDDLNNLNCRRAQDEAMYRGLLRPEVMEEDVNGWSVGGKPKGELKFDTTNASMSKKIRIHYKAC